jgi:hypothetical protein
MNQGTPEQRPLDDYLNKMLCALKTPEQGIADAGVSSSNPSTGKSHTGNVGSSATTSPPNTAQKGSSSKFQKLKDRGRALMG